MKRKGRIKKYLIFHTLQIIIYNFTELPIYEQEFQLPERTEHLLFIFNVY